MAVVYPTNGPPVPPEPSTGSRLASFVDQHIVLSIALALGVAVVIGFLINKLRGGSSSSANQQPQTLYVPTSNTFITSSTTQGGYNQATIRQRYQGADPAITAAYDASHAGVPLRGTLQGGSTSNNILGIIPWGAQVEITGNPQAGQSQWGDASLPGSNTLWYPVQYNGQSGEVSAYDISAINGAGGPLDSSSGATTPGGLPINFLGPPTPAPGTGSGGDPFQNGHTSPLRTIFSMNHGVQRHVTSAIGA